MFQDIAHILIQSRMGSTRLPGKSLLPFGNSTVVGYLYKSLLQHGFSGQSISFVIPDTPDNDELSFYFKKNKITFFRGSENDVLNRYAVAADQISQDIIVRLTGDNPLISTGLVECCIKRHIDSRADVTSTRLIDTNGKIKRFIPKGSSVDIFNKEIIKSIDAEDCSRYDKEHVIPAIFRKTQVNLVTRRELKLCGIELKLNQIISIDTQKDYQEALNCLK